MSFWRDTALVATREMRERGRSKTFVVSTLLTLILVVGAFVAAAVFSKSETAPTYKVALVGTQPADMESVLQQAATSADAVVTASVLPDEEAARAAIADGTIDAALLGNGSILVEKRGDTGLESMLTVARHQAAFMERLVGAGLSQAQVADLLAPSDNVEIVTVGKAGANEEGLAIASVGVVLLFVAISLYGQWVLIGVLEEKSNRVVELIVAAIPIRRLLAGKVIGIGALGVAQMVLLIGIALGAGLSLDIFTLPRTAVATTAWAIVWFLLGYAFYAVIYAAAGSLVSRQDDAQAATMPIALGAVAVYLATFAVVIPQPESIASRIFSVLPPVAPFALPARVALGAITPWEMALALVIMALSIYGMIRLAARVYTGALLESGPRLKWRQAFRAAGHMGRI
jgi:ABC-2 type transport system permease protein